MRNRDPDLPRLVGIIFSILLGIFPKAYRTRFGLEMREFVAQDYRERRGVQGGRLDISFWIGTFLRILSSALGVRIDSIRRGPGRRKGFSPGKAVGTLGLGLGACTWIFAVIQPVLLAPLPYPDSLRLVALYETGPGPDGPRGWVSPLTYRDWGERTETLEPMGNYRLNLFTWIGDSGPRILRGWAVSHGFFRVLGVEMALGGVHRGGRSAGGSRRGRTRQAVLDRELRGRSRGPGEDQDSGWISLHHRGSVRDRT